MRGDMPILATVALLAAAPGAGVVVCPVANMYRTATEEADVVSQAIHGSNVNLLEQQPGWFKARTADDYTGWMAAGCLRPAARPYAAAGRVARVDSLFAHLYREPDVTKHQPLLTVPFETNLEVVAEPENNGRRWIRVRLADEREAWLQRGDATFDTAPSSVEAVIALSKRFLGLPYTWGGTSSFGYDCSGFMQMLCRRRGVLLPRDAMPQSRWSGVQPVERGQLRPGDLLYFGRSAEKITHTGMYIGAGEFINATTHERPVVRIDQLDDPYWTKLFVAARRLK